MLSPERPDFQPLIAGDTSRLRITDPAAHQISMEAIGEGIFGFDSRDERSRPFNLLRGQLLRLAKKQGARIIAVTSATPKVGKTFISSNLAASLARLPELKTYLFDLDLRRSSVAENFKISGDAGITEFLDGRISNLRDAAWEIEGQSLTIFPSFSQKVLSSELLSSARMDELIAAMRSAPGPAICICDLPPVFANDDAVIISQKVDGYLLVIEEGVTTGKQVRDAIRLLEPAVCLGTVLNRYYGGLVTDDYGYGYSKKSEYSDYYN